MHPATEARPLAALTLPCSDCKDRPAIDVSAWACYGQAAAVAPAQLRTCTCTRCGGTGRVADPDRLDAAMEVARRLAAAGSGGFEVWCVQNALDPQAVRTTIASEGR